MGRGYGLAYYCSSYLPNARNLAFVGDTIRKTIGPSNFTSPFLWIELAVSSSITSSTRPTTSSTSAASTTPACLAMPTCRKSAVSVSVPKQSLSASSSARLRSPAHKTGQCAETGLWSIGVSVRSLASGRSSRTSSRLCNERRIALWTCRISIYQAERESYRPRANYCGVCSLRALHISG